jgi:SET domain-containing protein
MPPIPGLRVVTSGIHGYGVVAERDFAPGEVVAVVEGILWNSEMEDRDDRYSLWLDEDWYYDMVDQTRWMNHSCDPNCEIEADVQPDGSSPWAKVVAVRPIRPGDEITYDYAFDAELAEPCSCGAPACRGWIVEAEQLPALREKLGA